MLTRERAAEIHIAQMQFPYWGNYSKFMTDDEEAHVRGIFQQAESGDVTFASIVLSIKNGRTIPLKGAA